jgi:hypothetical protein
MGVKNETLMWLKINIRNKHSGLYCSIYALNCFTTVCQRSGVSIIIYRQRLVFIDVEHYHAVPSFIEHSIKFDHICVLKIPGRQSIKQISTTQTASTSHNQFKMVEEKSKNLATTGLHVLTLSSNEWEAI